MTNLPSFTKVLLVIFGVVSLGALGFFAARFLLGDAKISAIDTSDSYAPAEENKNVFDASPSEASEMTANEPGSIDRSQDIAVALQDPKWEALAAVFRDNCEVALDGVLNPNGLPFRAMIESLQPEAMRPDGAMVLVVPCQLQAYQSSEMAVVYDGSAYVPLSIERIDYEGNRTFSYVATGLAYDRANGNFTSYAKGRALGMCGLSTELALVDTKLILQKAEVDTECDEVDDWTVLFDQTN